MNVRSVVAFTPIVQDAVASAAFYRDTLAIELDGEQDVYLSTQGLPGLNHFGLWRLSDAARACFGSETWPADVPTPQACIEFDVDDLDVAIAELLAAGHQLLGQPETQPWGTTVVRLLSPEGLVVVIGHTPAQDSS